MSKNYSPFKIFLAPAALWCCLALLFDFDASKTNAKDPIAHLPDFASIKSVKEKKSHFFSYLRPYIEKENQIILNERNAILKLRDEDRLTPDHPLVKRLAAKYNIQETESTKVTELLLKRVGPIPLSLALSQAALESGWGTSRFAQEGNNLFGHWCFKQGCGMVPNARNKNATHEVAKFHSVQSSIKSYMLNLNSFEAYKPFRMLRAAQLKQNQALRGIDLAKGLESYSELGQDYIKKVIYLIKSNKLDLLDG